MILSEVLLMAGSGCISVQVATKYPANALIHRPILLDYITSNKVFGWRFLNETTILNIFEILSYCVVTSISCLSCKMIVIIQQFVIF